MYFNNIKHLAIGLLLINSMEFLYANNDTQHIVNGIDNIPNEETVKMELENNTQEENSKKVSHYEENDMNNSVVSHKGSTSYNNDEIDNIIFKDWDYNEKSKIKNKYKDLSDNLLKRNSTQAQDDPQSIITTNLPKVRKLSDASKSSVKSHFSNPLNISHRNVLKKIDEFLDSHEEIIPMIILQSDGLQVLDTIAHLLAFNSFYNLSNFGVSPYIFCASSASIPGLSLALDLQNSEDPVMHLEQIGQKLYEQSQEKNTNIIKKKCNLCNCNTFELIWLSLFGCCIDYDEDNIVDSLYTKINKKTANDIIKNTLSLDYNSNISIPNLVIKDANCDTGIVNQVLQANNSQDKKSTKNQIKLFAEPIVSFIKNFVDCKKQAVEKGIDIVEKNTNDTDLIRISSKDEKNFIQQKKLDDSTVDRLFLILSSDVDNDGKAQKDSNNIKIEYKEIEYEKSEDKFHAIKISLYTVNSITNQNYLLKEKINNVKSMLENSSEFKYIVNNLPQMNSSYHSSKSSSSEELKIQNISTEQ